MRGPLRNITKVEQKPRHPHAKADTLPGLVIYLECGHFKEVNPRDMPKFGKATCRDCLKQQHVPLNLEERLRTL